MINTIFWYNNLVSNEIWLIECFSGHIPTKLRTLLGYVRKVRLLYYISLIYLKHVLLSNMMFLYAKNVLFSAFIFNCPYWSVHWESGKWLILNMFSWILLDKWGHCGVKCSTCRTDNCRALFTNHTNHGLRQHWQCLSNGTTSYWLQFNIYMCIH